MKSILLGARLALDDYPGVKLAKKLRDGEGFEYELACDISSFLIGCRKDDLVLFENCDIEEIKPVAKQFENVLFECLDCKKVFRVHKETGTIGTLEPCPDCGKPCIRRLPEALDIEFSNSCLGVKCICCPKGQPNYSRKIGLMKEETFAPLCPALSLPNMLVIRSIMGTRRTLVFIGLICVMATLSGKIFGAFWG